jgi:hypothetical protein
VSLGQGKESIAADVAGGAGAAQKSAYRADRRWLMADPRLDVQEYPFRRHDCRWRQR